MGCDFVARLNGLYFVFDSCLFVFKKLKPPNRITRTSNDDVRQRFNDARQSRFGSHKTERTIKRFHQKLEHVFRMRREFVNGLVKLSVKISSQPSRIAGRPLGQIILGGVTKNIRFGFVQAL